MAEEEASLDLLDEDIYIDEEMEYILQLVSNSLHPSFSKLCTPGFFQ